jgi:FkbM family methyltransferase
MLRGQNERVANGAGEVSISGFSISGDRSAHGDYLRALGARHAPRFATRLFAESIPRGGAVVHAGAYLGYHALIAARHAGPRGRVMAFEPNPVSYRCLRSNVRRNGYGDRVIALPLGIAAWSGRRTFYLGEGDGRTSSLFVPERWLESTETRTLSLDSTIGGRALDVIKLTVAGGEVEALRGMRRTLELSPTARLFVECDPRALVRAGSGVAALLEELRGLEMRTRVIDEDNEGLTAVGDWLADSSGRVQLLCEPAAVTRRLARRVRTARREPSAAPA